MPSRPAAEGLNTHHSRRLRKASPARSDSSHASSERADSASGQAARASAAVAELVDCNRPSSARQQEASAAIPTDAQALLSTLEAAVANSDSARLDSCSNSSFFRGTLRLMQRSLLILWRPLPLPDAPVPLTTCQTCRRQSSNAPS